ncbi:transcriptional regulator, PadR family [Aeromicrobium marinum DSM 15272]|uniref:Transcriptional regulator, PadR family n=2 Tax=Aeromicrobium marinum TaxID=219314 RepID=E2S8N3_9ACTN|nr:transcriptional regulator, PadR family [Aeromicrobium marinum DSM 15272]
MVDHRDDTMYRLDISTPLNDGIGMARRGAALELAVLGLLHDSPMHGYELRKQLIALLGWGRVLSYGTLYPCLKALVRSGQIVADEDLAVPVRGRRNRIVYRLTAEGKEHFASVMEESGPATWDDDNFGVRFAFFARTDSPTRVRILEGRRSRLEERLENVRDASQRGRERADSYTRELQRHGLESVEREVSWLTELIDRERAGGYLTTDGADDDPDTTNTQTA